MKVLVIRFSSIGDIVLTTPVLRTLKLQRQATVHYFTKENFASLLSPNPYIDKIWTFQKYLREVLPALRAEHFDYVIDLHNNLRSWQVRRALGVRTYAFHKLTLKKWLFVNFKINQLPDLHIVDRYMATLAALGVKNDGQGLDFFLPETARTTATQFLTQIGFTSHTYIALVIGAAHATKKLPPAQLTRLCQLLPYPIVLLAGKEEATIGDTLAAIDPLRIVNTCGKFSLAASAAMIAQAHAVITPDTGLMHIAAALHKPIISVWGNTVPAFGMYPYSPKGKKNDVIIENKALGCRPCSKIGYAQCPKGHFRCMNDLDMEAVVRALTPLA